MQIELILHSYMQSLMLLILQIAHIHYISLDQFMICCSEVENKQRKSNSKKVKSSAKTRKLKGAYYGVRSADLYVITEIFRNLLVCKGWDLI